VKTLLTENASSARGPGNFSVPPGNIPCQMPLRKISSIFQPYHFDFPSLLPLPFDLATSNYRPFHLHFSTLQLSSPCHLHLLTMPPPSSDITTSTFRPSHIYLIPYPPSDLATSTFLPCSSLPPSFLPSPPFDPATLTFCHLHLPTLPPAHFYPATYDPLLPPFSDPVIPPRIAEGDRMFLGIQDFDFAQVCPNFG